MLSKRILLRNGLIFLSLLGMGALFLASLSPFTEQDLASRLQQDPISLDVPVIQQSIGTSCGEAAITIAYNYAYPQSPITEQQAINFATEQGYFTPGVPPYTSPANMVKVAEHYVDKVSSGAVQDPDQGLSLLVQYLEDGTPVIIDVLSDLADPGSEAHFVIVTGISVAPDRQNEFVIHYNDPLTGTKQSADWSGPQGIWNAWQNNGDPGGPGWWMAIPPQ